MTAASHSRSGPYVGRPAPYVGRFAPSPSGPLHEGSLVAALASFLDARAHGGRWLLRIEDIDTPRIVPGADQVIMGQLAALGLHWDGPPVWQSARQTLYEHAFTCLQGDGRVYACRCTRRELPPGPYPGTCRMLLNEPRGAVPGRRRVRSWRFRVEAGTETFEDRWMGLQSQDVAREVGDFIIRRADGPWAYQLVVVVDDADQGVTDIVRGADLLDSTARQRQLARALGLPAPRTLHVPLITDEAGRKLSKQNHAPGLEVRNPLPCLTRAWHALGFDDFPAQGLGEFLTEATRRWAQRFP
ncbi:Glutamyl-Q tRNA(Asp) synthetase OS=Castellaniella defragrans OX=75697 GN=gluQ PE=3 SV=1 [Castellaniella defragrans]